MGRVGTTFLLLDRQEKMAVPEEGSGEPELMFY